MSSELANEELANEELANELMANELRGGEQAQLRVGKKAGVKYNFDT